MKPRSDLKVSLFQISEDMRIGLLNASAKSILNGNKESINDCILEALREYLSLPDGTQPKPAVQKLASVKYTVRMTSEVKNQIAQAAAKWQLKTGLPVSMNAVVNAAIALYLAKDGK